MKVLLTHCYSDKNVGDSAIIVGTVKYLLKLHNCEINAQSTFSSSDSRFLNNHKQFKYCLNKIYPAIFPEPGKEGCSNLKKSFYFILYFLRFLLVYVDKDQKLCKFILPTSYLNSLNVFKQSKIVISKGGSFLYTDTSSIRSTLQLIRILSTFYLSKRYRIRTIILAQSIGPIYGRINMILLRYALKHVDSIYLREFLCLQEYKSIFYNISSKLKFCPDMAFYLSRIYNNYTIKNVFQNKVGIVIVDHAFLTCENVLERKSLKENYKSFCISLLEELSKQYCITLYSQVLVDTSQFKNNDQKFSKKLYEIFSDNPNVYINDFCANISNVIDNYNKQDIIIGFRLHSCILASISNTPFINISYHGTKSEGILQSFDLGYQNVFNIADFDYQPILESIEFIKNNYHTISSKIRYDSDILVDEYKKIII
jgi:colanic acid/amylovoran biosynthesis protein